MNNNFKKVVCCAISLLLFAGVGCTKKNNYVIQSKAKNLDNIHVYVFGILRFA